MENKVRIVKHLTKYSSIDFTKAGNKQANYLSKRVISFNQMARSFAIDFANKVRYSQHHHFVFQNANALATQMIVSKIE